MLAFPQKNAIRSILALRNQNPILRKDGTLPNTLGCQDHYCFRTIFEPTMTFWFLRKKVEKSLVRLNFQKEQC